MHPIHHSCWLSIVIIVFVALVPAVVHSATLATDTEVLRLLKRSIDPNTVPRSSFLNSWDFKSDPCESTGGQFLGILCTSPSDNSSNSRITAIYLDSIGYDGFLTPSIGNLTELTILDLRRNNFRGPIPDTISNLRKLTTLSLPGNFFTGSIPVGITGLKKLQMIDLSHNSLSGSIPAQFSGLRQLTHLSLSHNAFSGNIPSLRGAWQLHTLSLDDNQLYGNLPKLPTNLRTLSLNHNLLTGHVSSLRNLVNLKSLDLSYNRFTGSISHQVLDLPQVVSIDFSVNRFTAIEVTTLTGKGTQLQELEVQGNLLRGHLPINLVILQRLTSINLAHNQFSGHIPKEYGVKLGRPWRNLFLDHNFLSGDLPPEFNGPKGIRGSLERNCLRCPRSIPLCHGGQRPASECAGQKDQSD